jgi:1-pyrroline-5-carboxylate dehydrogenase
MSAPVADRATSAESAGTNGASPRTPVIAGITGFNGIRRVPLAYNEPIRTYAPGSPEKASLKARLASVAAERVEIPIIIGGKEYRTGDLGHAVMPHNHQNVLADFHKAESKHVLMAIDAARDAHREWSNWPWEDRVAVFLKAAELLAGKWRDTLNAATMLGQSKTVYQAEIDAACELIDFWRFNASYAQDLYAEQPQSSAGVWNMSDYRALEGFVYAISPFNFTAIGGNLAGSPAMMGNTVIWKPAATAMLSAYYVYKVLEEAGLPPGVINFIPGDPVMISDSVLKHRDLAGVHFTGSTGVFNSMWKTIGANMSGYRSYPRIVGETGGKDFIVAHPSADPAVLAVAIARGGFEYQGQKCSAASRAYIPRSLWNEVRDRTVAIMKEIKQGDVTDFRNFMAAVIDKKAFDKISGYLDDAKKNARVISGGGAKGDAGYFIEPTLIEAPSADYRLMCEEIFGPVVTTFVYDDDKWADTLATVDATSPYALTGSIFSNDRQGVRDAVLALRNAAGNFYINDKPTGAVVGQQPFGGSRASGTNDKAGSKLNLLRWVSPRSIKETLAPATDYRYPFMAEE